VLVHDNSPSTPEALLDPPVPEGFLYRRAAKNRGLFGAYDAALAMARAGGYEWLLTLDQDTVLPADFFPALVPGLSAAAEDLRIAAIVPHLAEGERLLSPTYVGVGRARPLPREFSGVPAREARAFNSAALLRGSAIEEIGGFEPCFWLDYLDSWLHHQFFRHGWRMYVLGSVHLQHHLSLLNYRERMSISRFRNFLMAEAAYIDLFGTWWERALYSAQLGVRLINQYRRHESAEIRKATWAALMRRMRVRRGRRMREWRESGGCAAGASLSRAGEL